VNVEKQLIQLDPEQANKSAEVINTAVACSMHDT
jgi:hypothetical protein